MRAYLQHTELSTSDLMYRDESETLLDDGHSHSFATAFLRNFRCSAVMSTNVWVCQAVKK